MKLKQLKYIVEIVKHNLNISSTANGLYTSQPGISKQIKILEDELGIKIFIRKGKHLNKLTTIGKKIVYIAKDIIFKINNIKLLANNFNNPYKGTLCLFTTHTQSCYILPNIVKKFILNYPDIELSIHQGSPTQIANAIFNNIADFIITTESLYLYKNLITIPCYYWHRIVIVKKGHLLSKIKSISIHELSKHPIITYTFSFYYESDLFEAFNKKKLKPNIIFTATDSNVIKTYVRMGLGIGIISNMSINKYLDNDLVIIKLKSTFSKSFIKIGFKKDTFLKEYMYNFIYYFAPHVNKNTIDNLIKK